ncbi:crotonase/enoyl-CoA hydratase family protein [Pseudonocardia humida]|uniref:Crotonase/enoyl-CoA hydratase family protein n=1 Tax=Pseudonocardia humida TaxID=2800819 RepID=A0ABT0ZVC6_9PSEU|nr:crotonase/enoyl-CoA hydratase family protein [Pseudonocardia humida]MCO1654698.1 crotonase/enoyl-CoA hydratase family protein [Pseudonocardia humida]
MGNRVGYELGDDGVATITMDDGKVNALSVGMLGDVGAAFDQAESDGAAVLLTGRRGVFSGGFDLRVIRGGDPAAALAMVRAGFELAERVLSFPRPVVAAAPGHAVAMGAFLLLSADLRIGVAAPSRYTANEVAIGLSVPSAALAILRYRLTPSEADRAAVTAAVYGPREAKVAGFLHEVVEPDALPATARGWAAAAASGLDAEGHRATKLRARADVLDELRAGISELVAARS